MVEPGDTKVRVPWMSQIYCGQTAQRNTSRKDRFFLPSNIQVDSSAQQNNLALKQRILPKVSNLGKY